MRVGECGLLQISCQWSVWVYVNCHCQFTSQPVATRGDTLLITHSSLLSCRDEHWTYMYKIDGAAAAFHLVLQLHSASGLHIFDHVSRPAVDTVAGCSSQPNGSQHLNCVITKFALY